MPARKAERLKLVAGTARPDRAPKRDGAERLVVPPEPPDHLDARAQAEWCRVAQAAVSLGTLTTADLAALELLAKTLATEAAACELLAQQGFTCMTAEGGMKSHPAVRIMEAARGQARALLSDFGLTPRAKQGVDIAPPSGRRNAFEDLD